MASPVLRVAFWIGLAACALIAMGGAILPSLPEPVGRAVLMIGIPLVPAAFFALGIVALVAALVVIALLQPGNRPSSSTVATRSPTARVRRSRSGSPARSSAR